MCGICWSPTMGLQAKTGGEEKSDPRLCFNDTSFAVHIGFTDVRAHVQQQFD